MTEERAAEDKAGGPEADVLTKMTHVSEARNVAGDSPCVVPRDMDVREVVRDGRLVGLITRADIVRTLAEEP
jgi:CBS domain-containing protein